MAQTVSVLNASHWKFTKEGTGEFLQGYRVTFLSEVENSEQFSGQRVSEASLTEDQFKQLKGHLPNMCEVDFAIVPGAKGKATVKVVTIKPVKAK